MGSGGEEVAAIIFGCDQQTEEECLGRNLFGLPITFKDTILKTQQGTTVFLFNYYTRVLHGVFEAKSAGGFNINCHAYGQMTYKDGTTGSRFPSQLCVQRVKNAGSIPENKFKNIIKDNYYHKSKFHPFLTQEQLQEILQLFDNQFEEQNAKRGLEEAGPSDQQAKKQKTNVQRGTEIQLGLVQSGEDDRTNICIKMMSAIVPPLQMLKVISRCIPRQFDFVSILKMSGRGGTRDAYNLFVNCTGADAVQRIHWWLHGNKWTDIWAAVSGQQYLNYDFIVNLEFAKTQGLKEIVSKFGNDFSISTTDPIEWNSLPGWRIWLQSYTEPVLVDEVEDYLNKSRIQLRQQQLNQQHKKKAKQERYKKNKQDTAQNENNFGDGNLEADEDYIVLEEGLAGQQQQNEQNQANFNQNIPNNNSESKQQRNRAVSSELILQIDEDGSAEKFV